MGDRTAAKVAILHDVDDAPVGQRAGGEARDLAQRLLVIERLGGHGAGLGQEAQASLGPLALGDVPADAEDADDDALTLDQLGL